jgi:hypothetical protein
MDGSYHLVGSIAFQLSDELERTAGEWTASFALYLLDNCAPLRNRPRQPGLCVL